jgi:predicted signal transduction protein with EAL and GGDEF domain
VVLGDEDEIAGRLEALQALMRAPIRCAARSVDARVTFGLADGVGAEARQLASAAVVAAQRALDGNAGWERVSADERAQNDWKLSLAGELDEAIETGALWVAYQPKYSMTEGRTTGAEALVRWRHPVRGVIPPDEFIPVIEQHNRADALTNFVLDTAVADAGRWHKAGHSLNVAVNISATLVARPELIEAISSDAGAAWACRPSC